VTVKMLKSFTKWQMSMMSVVSWFVLCSL